MNIQASTEMAVSAVEAMYTPRVIMNSRLRPNRSVM